MPADQHLSKSLARRQRSGCAVQLQCVNVFDSMAAAAWLAATTCTATCPKAAPSAVGGVRVRDESLRHQGPTVGSPGQAIRSAHQSLRSSERSRGRGIATPIRPAPMAMPMVAGCLASGKAAAPHPPASSAAPTASMSRRMALFGVIAARIPCALIRAPLPAHEKPRRALAGGRGCSRSAGGFGPAFYSSHARQARTVRRRPHLPDDPTCRRPAIVLS